MKYRHVFASIHKGLLRHGPLLHSGDLTTVKSVEGEVGINSSQGKDGGIGKKISGLRFLGICIASYASITYRTDEQSLEIIMRRVKRLEERHWDEATAFKEEEIAVSSRECSDSQIILTQLKIHQSLAFADEDETTCAVEGYLTLLKNRLIAVTGPLWKSLAEMHQAKWYLCGELNTIQATKNSTPDS